MKILFRDKDIIVCIKPAGVVSTDEPGGMPELIRKEIGEELPVRTVHRLDSVVAGLMVYALSQEAASGLSTQITDGSFTKEYMAVTEGCLTEKAGELRDWLRRNQKERKTYAVEKMGRDAQEAILLYHVLSEKEDCSLVRVKLITGRTHQIRAQFSSRSLPLYGDRKYGAVHKDAGIALWSCHLLFRHPITGEEMDFSAMPPTRTPWIMFDGYHTAYEEQDVQVEFKRSAAFGNCPHAYACEGCIYQGMDYEKQLEKKQKLADKNLRQYGKVEEILSPEELLHYRNKTVAAFAFNKDGKLITGSPSGKGRKFVRTDRCLLNQDQAEALIRTLQALLIRYEIPVFDDRKKSGWLRQVQIRTSGTDGSALVTMVAASEDFKDKKAFLKELISLHPEVQSVVLNVNPAASPAPFGKTEKVLYGPGYIEDEICGRKYRLYTKSFFPVYSRQTESLYKCMLDSLMLTGEERVLDVSSSNGILGILIAPHVKKVLGVDLFRDVIKEAEENRSANEIENIRFISSDPAEYVQALARSHEKMDLVLLDSGRARVTKECIEAIAKLAPKKILFLSGNPEAMAKDLALLTKAGYKAVKIQPSDAMPFTATLETGVLLTR